MKYKSSLLSKYNSKFVRHYNLYSYFLMRYGGRADFMNLGFNPHYTPFKLEEKDIPNLKYISLYCKLLEGFDNNISNILEISSGLGGGCYLLKHYYSIPEVIGVDYARLNVKYSNKKFNNLGINFYKFSSDNVNKLNKKFDTIISLEASQHYDDWELFLKNTSSLLNENGVFYYADMFTPGDQMIIEKLMLETGWKINKKENITDGIINSINMVQPPAIKSRYYKAICTFLNLNSLDEFEAYNNSKLHQLFKEGELNYIKYILTKSLS